ncbi:unnamed protein product [Chrysoparadoxa australica]
MALRTGLVRSRNVMQGHHSYRMMSQQAADSLRERNKRLAMYMSAVVIGVGGLSYAAVPLYKAFCQATGFGGTTQVADAKKAASMKPVEGGRIIRVTFDGTVSDTLPWQFTAAQLDVRVVPGETALAFYRAKNCSDKNITGVATYNVFPLKAGLYFNKIQCFCFEEQRLKAGEEVDMPVFFYLDPELLDDPAMDNVQNITLSYTFFNVDEDQEEDEEEEKEGAVAAKEDVKADEKTSKGSDRRTGAVHGHRLGHS